MKIFGAAKGTDKLVNVRSVAEDQRMARRELHLNVACQPGSPRFADVRHGLGPLIIIQ